jgi:uncharacterized membrane protein
MFGHPWNSHGLWFMFSLVLALWAVFHIAQSRSGPFGKAIWIVAVLFIPFLGFLAWFLFGPRRA